MATKRKGGRPAIATWGTTKRVSPKLKGRATSGRGRGAVRKVAKSKPSRRRYR